MTRTETPRTMALKFRIWAYAAPKGWDVTFNDVAAALDVSAQRVSIVAHRAGWVERFRVSKVADYTLSGPAFMGSHMARDIVAGRIGYAG